MANFQYFPYVDPGAIYLARCAAPVNIQLSAVDNTGFLLVNLGKSRLGGFFDTFGYGT